MTHKFDVKNKHKLDNEKRREAMPPYQTLERLGLKKGDDMADIGCGIGYFSIPAGEIIGDTAKVFALDVSMEMLEEVEKRAADNKVMNIRTIKSDEYDFKLNSEAVDFVLVSNVLHEIDEKEKFITEVRRILRSNGRVAIVEWQKAHTEYGPPIDHRISSDDTAELLMQAGLSVTSHLDIGQYYYGVVASLD